MPGVENLRAAAHQNLRMFHQGIKSRCVIENPLR